MSTVTVRLFGGPRDGEIRDIDRRHVENWEPVKVWEPQQAEKHPPGKPPPRLPPEHEYRPAIVKYSPAGTGPNGPDRETLLALAFIHTSTTPEDHKLWRSAGRSVDEVEPVPGVIPIPTNRNRND